MLTQRKMHEFASRITTLDPIWKVLTTRTEQITLSGEDTEAIIRLQNRGQTFHSVHVNTSMDVPSKYVSPKINMMLIDDLI
jgi:hypothetical protein